METNAQYHADFSHYSNSMNGDYLDCPSYWRDVYFLRTRDRKPQTHDMKIGSAVHALKLEGEEVFSSLHIVADNAPVNPNTGKPYGEGSQKFKDWLGEQILDRDRDYLNIDDYELVRSVVRSLNESEQARRYLDVGGEIEKSIRWVREDGTKCKAKLDIILPPEVYGVRVVVDLKVLKDSTPKGFAKSMADYGYHRQAAWYMEPFRDDPEPTEFVFVAVGKTKPYEVYVYFMPDEVLEVGRRENEETLRRIKISIKKNLWLKPEQAQVNTVSLPKWYKEIERIT